MGYSRQREINKLTNSGEQQGQDKNNTDITPKTKNK